MGITKRKGRKEREQRKDCNGKKNPWITHQKKRKRNERVYSPLMKWKRTKTRTALSRRGQLAFPASVPQQLLKPFAEPEKLHVHPVRREVSVIHDKRLAFADELIEVLDARDGELRFVGAAGAGEV